MKTANKHPLGNSPKFTRTTLAKGIKTRSGVPVDREGGKYGAGKIEGYAVITRGEALGHSLWIDREFLNSVAGHMDVAGLSEAGGIKSRFTHPGLSSDGLASFLGRTNNATIDGDIVRGDLHLAASAHETPDGDLAGYVMARAEEDPASFGASIVFERDRAAEDAFMEGLGARVSYNEFGGREVRDFVSPDPDNVNHYPHARLKQLMAVDAVDDPAANPQGLFYRGQEFAQQAEAVLSFSLGLTAEQPGETDFGVDSQRLKNFVDSFLTRHGLALVPQLKQGESMPEDQKPADDAAPKAEEPKKDEAAPPADAPKAEEPPKSEEPKTEPETQASAGKKFLEAFGPDGGVWYAEGLTFAQAADKHVAKLAAAVKTLSADNAELRKQLAANRGEAGPVAFASEPSAEERAVADLTHKVGSPGVARFAAGLKVGSGK